MAKVLNEFDFRSGRAGGHEKYPWAEWFDGRIWKLSPEGWDSKEEPGDFVGSPEDFWTTCYSAAKRRGVKIKTSVNTVENYLVIQKVADLTPVES